MYNLHSKVYNHVQKSSHIRLKQLLPLNIYQHIWKIIEMLLKLFDMQSKDLHIGYTDK